MDVATSMKEVEDLSGLGDRREQRIITALAFFLLVKSHSRPFRMATRALHASVQVKRDAFDSFLLKSRQANEMIHLPHPLKALTIDLSQHPAHRWDTGQLVHPQNLSYKGIISVVVQIAKHPVAQYKMHDKTHENLVELVEAGPAPIQWIKALLKLPFQIQFLKELLKDNETAERGQFLIFKFDRRNRSGLCINRTSCYSHS